MKRVLILICCICLVVCLAAPAFAAGVSWQDYVVTTTPGFDYDTNDIFIPGDEISCSFWMNVPHQVTGSTVSFSLSASTDLQLRSEIFRNSYLALDDFEHQDTLDLFFRFSDEKLANGQYFRYSWMDGDSVISQHFAFTGRSGWDYKVSIDLTARPSNATGINFSFECRENLPAGDYSVEFLGLSFTVLSDPTAKLSPVVISPEDYLVNESSNGDTSTLYVSVPSSDLSIMWNLLRDDDYSTLTQYVGNPFPVYFDRHDYDYWIGCQVFDKLDITDIVDGSTMNVKFDISPTVTDSEPVVPSVRYQVRYYDKAGNILENVNFFTVPGADWFTETSLDIDVDKPAGAVTMSFIVQFMDIYSEQLPASFVLDLKSVDFECDIPTMVRVQQETGRTNQLLDELVNGDHGFDSSGSNFGSDADSLAGAGDQMDDAMGTGMDSLGAMTNSPMFTGTLATLAGAMDAIFVGHEITICGVTANPFTLLVTILAIAILLPLALKYVFRKRGSG